jgi:hypothetical protein
LTQRPIFDLVMRPASTNRDRWWLTVGLGSSGWLASPDGFDVADGGCGGAGDELGADVEGGLEAVEDEAQGAVRYRHE